MTNAPAPTQSSAKCLPIADPLPEPSRNRICCIVPCYDVGRFCASVVRECARHAGRVIAVDDGSTDDTPQQLSQAMSETPDVISVLRHPRNCGKGVALMNGFHHALTQTTCDVIVTLDGDGQHRPGDIPHVVRPCLAGQADLVIAQRQFPKNMPARSRIGNNLCSAVLSRIYRETPRDTQCGLRAHSRRLIEEIVRDIVGNRYDTEARIVMRSLFLKRQIGQVPIPAIYHGRNESSHYRVLADSLTILQAFVTTVVLPELGIAMPFLWSGRTASAARAFRRMGGVESRGFESPI